MGDAGGNRLGVLAVTAAVLGRLASRLAPSNAAVGERPARIEDTLRLLDGLLAAARRLLELAADLLLAFEQHLEVVVRFVDALHEVGDCCGNVR